MNIKLIFLVFLTMILEAKYTNCEFQNSHYGDICNKVVKNGVSYDYANRFLLDYFKTQKFDEKSWEYLHPKNIKTFKKNEKKANNTLVEHIPRLVKHIKKYKEVYDLSEEKYGVNREIVGAILLKETSLGSVALNHDAFIVFNTIVTRVKEETKRDEWLLNMGKNSMASIIEHCYKAQIEPIKCNLPSSYAGAVGIAQFIPSSFMYVKGYNSKVGDLNKMEDSIMSVSYYLHRRAKFDKLIEWNKIGDMEKIEDEWYEYEHAHNHEKVSFSYKKGRNGKAYDCFACGKKDLDYVDEYVQKILKYNNSSNYAIGVLRIAYDANKLLKGE